MRSEVLLAERSDIVHIVRPVTHVMLAVVQEGTVTKLHHCTPMLTVIEQTAVAFMF